MGIKSRLEKLEKAAPVNDGEGLTIDLGVADPYGSDQPYIIAAEAVSALLKVYGQHEN